jgi:hypothetical protein
MQVCKGPLTLIEVHARCTIFVVGRLILTKIPDSGLYYNLQHTTLHYEAKTIRKVMTRVTTLAGPLEDSDRGRHLLPY